MIVILLDKEASQRMVLLTLCAFHLNQTMQDTTEILAG